MPSFKTPTSLLLAALAVAPSLVSAHGHVVSITVNGKEIPGFEPGNPSANSVGWATTVQDNGFVLADALSSDDIVCHRGATNAANSATVAAGDTISIKWDTWPTSHVGPIIDYLASCDGDCSTVEKTSLEFFKFNEGGLIDGSNAPGRWVTDELIENNLTWDTTIPATLAPGSYVLRHEIVALHEGDRQNAAQMYPQCINIEVTGSGTELPAGIVATELYTASDPGIFFNPYKVNTDYPIPGPALAFGAGGGSSPAPAPAPSAPAASSAPVPSSAPAPPPANGGNDAPASSVAAPAPTTLVTATRAPVAEPTQPADDGDSCGGAPVKGQSLYGQCGGIGFTGPTTCAQGTCTKQNDYYFQCI